jgi:hypothetical protein
MGSIFDVRFEFLRSQIAISKYYYEKYINNHICHPFGAFQQGGIISWGQKYDPTLQDFASLMLKKRPHMDLLDDHKKTTCGLYLMLMKKPHVHYI